MDWEQTSCPPFVLIGNRWLNIYPIKNILCKIFPEKPGEETGRKYVMV
jgi:hypothetical protein